MSKIFRRGEEVTDEKIIEYVKNLYTYLEKNSEMVALYTEEYEQIYSNINNIEEADIKSILNQETDLYVLRQIENRHYMLFSSHWSINNKIIYLVNVYDIEAIYEEKDRQMEAILVTDCIILAVSAVVIFVFSVFLTNPINRLNKTSKKIAAGQFQERVRIRSKDEIGELASSFNTMAEQVENKINELHAQVKRKNDFITGFTHELKTPMTAIVGYADLLRLKKCDEEVTQKAVQYIYSETKRLESLSFKLMKLMGLTEEKIQMQDFEVKELMEKVAKAENSVVMPNQLELKIEPRKVLGDSELLEVVMRNLVENANKAEPKDHKIVIKGESLMDKKYRISVLDKGKGIPKEHIQRVTEDFYMVDKSRSRMHGGSGIGLSLVKKILELHHTEIWIESEEDVGTTVYFELEEGEEV